MKNLALPLFVFGLFSAASFGQATRTRVVPTPTPQAPTIQNDTSSPSAVRRPPVFASPNGSRPQPSATATPPATGGQVMGNSDEEIRVETNLVTMPVSVLDRDGRFVSGLTQRDFEIYENGAAQKIEYFQSVEQPFTVILMIDVSPSTQFRIDEIHNAAISFVNQLRPSDKVMVMSFDERVRVLTEPTNDRTRLRWAILGTDFGDGTSLYEAVDDAINRQLARIQGRKAVVLFTDGVDTTSRRASIDSTLADVEETEALFYPIRFNTQRQGLGGGMGYPGGRRTRRGGSGGWGTIIGGIILGGQLPVPVYGGGGVGGPMGGSRGDYERGDQYLTELAVRSGGRKFDADTTTDLDAAFGGIAEELRRQYSVGYYPDNVGTQGERRQIKVRVMRQGLVVRAKTSYVVGDTGRSNTGR
jgi:Ca-activated chloride channel homolog